MKDSDCDYLIEKHGRHAHCDECDACWTVNNQHTRTCSHAANGRTITTTRTARS